MVRKKKEVIKPVVAKPLNDTEKRNLVSSFVTSNVNENVTNDVTKYDTDNVTKTVTNNDIKSVTNIITKNETEFVTNNDTVEVTSGVTKGDIKSVANNVTNNETKVVTESDTLNVTIKDTEGVTKKVTKDVTIIKSILLGKKEIVAKFTSNKRLRPNYNLSEDTIEKIEKISDILGYKKADFVDIYLNGTLTKVLKDLEKSK